MGWLVNWLIKELIIAVGSLYSFLTNGLSNFFDNELINSLFSLFSWFGYVLYGIGTLFALFAFREATADGEITSLYEFGKGLILGFVAIVAIPYYLVLFTLTIKLSSLMVSDITTSLSDPEFSLVTELLNKTGAGFISLIIALLLFIASFALVWGTLKRVGEAVIYCFIMFLSVFGITRGDYSMFSGSITKAIGLLFVQALHAPLYFAGMVYLFEGLNRGISNTPELITSIIFFVMSISLPKVVDSTLQSSTGGRGGMMHSVNTAVMALRSFR